MQNKIRITNLIDKIKFLFRKERELNSSLYKILGFYPHDVDLYRLAFSHKSLSPRGGDKTGLLNNERLEFLGDAIIEAAISDIIFHHFNDKREGFLTTTRSKLVQRETLNKLSNELGLADFISTASTSFSGHNSYLAGNAFEALVGAIYLDRGYTYSKWFLKKRILDQHIDIDQMAYKEVNFKSKLLEWSQKKRVCIEYQQETSEEVKGCSPVFHCSLSLEGISVGYGNGFSKKQSQQNASKAALENLGADSCLKTKILEARNKRLNDQKTSDETFTVATEKASGGSYAPSKMVSSKNVS